MDHYFESLYLALGFLLSYAFASPSFYYTLSQEVATSSFDQGRTVRKPIIRKEIEVFAPYNLHHDLPQVLETSSPELKIVSQTYPPSSNIKHLKRILQMGKQPNPQNDKILEPLSWYLKNLVSKMNRGAYFEDLEFGRNPKTDIQTYIKSSNTENLKKILDIGKHSRGFEGVKYLVQHLELLMLKIKNLDKESLTAKNFDHSAFVRKPEFERVLVSAVETLEDFSLGPRETIWALAVLKHLQGHLIQGERKPIRTDMVQGPICRAALGLGLTKEFDLMGASKTLGSSHVEPELMAIHFPEINGMIENERLENSAFKKAYDNEVVNFTFKKENKQLLHDISSFLTLNWNNQIGKIFAHFQDPRFANVHDVKEAINHIKHRVHGFNEDRPQSRCAVKSWTAEEIDQVIRLLDRTAIHIPDAKQYLQSQVEWSSKFLSLLQFCMQDDN
ncbi:hypothetical protein DFH28DRAFT_900336 [Melampsora americana]|nr:hypothetical protein DFH28DRAFT_900336 [Melampsora americana]